MCFEPYAKLRASAEFAHTRNLALAVALSLSYLFGCSSVSVLALALKSLSAHVMWISNCFTIVLHYLLGHTNLWLGICICVVYAWECDECEMNAMTCSSFQNAVGFTWRILECVKCLVRWRQPCHAGNTNRWLHQLRKLIKRRKRMSKKNLFQKFILVRLPTDKDRKCFCVLHRTICSIR